MGQKAIHPLRQWRLDRGHTLAEAAAAIGTYRQTWHDWEIGRRIPDRFYMRRLYGLTGGAITPNHFYNLPELDDPALPLNAGPVPLLDRIANNGGHKPHRAALVVAA